MASAFVDSFSENFSEVQDPRTRPVDNPLEEILFLSVCATIAGADGPSDIEEFGWTHLAWLRRFFPLANEVPSHDTISRVFALLKPREFNKLF